LELNSNSDPAQAVCLEDLLGINNKTKGKAHNQTNTHNQNSVTKNQEHFGHRKRIKP
jgi:hypothetical protein